MTVIWHASRHTWLYYGTCFLSIFPCLTCYAVHTSTYARYLCRRSTYDSSPSFCILYSAYCILNSVFCILHTVFCILDSLFFILCPILCTRHAVFCMLYAVCWDLIYLDVVIYFLFPASPLFLTFNTYLTFTCVLYVFNRVCVILCWIVLGSLVNLKHSCWSHSHHCSLVSRFTSYYLSWF
jgi:hypothetical protein